MLVVTPLGTSIANIQKRSHVSQRCLHQSLKPLSNPSHTRQSATNMLREVPAIYFDGVVSDDDVCAALCVSVVADNHQVAAATCG